MSKLLALLAVIVVALAEQGGKLNTYVVPLRITAIPSESFRKGTTVTLKATFDRAKVEAITGVLCQDPGFAIRIYDPAKVPTNGPLLKAGTDHPQLHPMTPYIQETKAPFDLSGPNTLTVAKTFQPFAMPSSTTVNLPRLYVGLFRICDFNSGGKVIGDAGSGPEVIAQVERTGTFLAAATFKWNCPRRGKCSYKQE